MTRLKDKILGCMVGGAVGDALGYSVEFMSYNHILAKYGPKGITRYDLNSKGIAEISDDTQMSLYTANGLLIDDIQGAYLEWLDTQSYAGKPSNDAKCWLSRVPEMYSRRAPGNTCMSSLHNIKAGKIVSNDSKGCGGIMRVAPIGIYCVTRNLGLRKAVAMGCEAARLTHLHPLGWLSAGIFSGLIYQLLEKELSSLGELFDMLIMARREAYNIYYNATTDYALSTLEEGINSLFWHAEDSSKSDVEALMQYGEGWTGEEALFIALCCAVRHIHSFEDAVVAAVNHSGDSDSTGAITGNLMGAIHGYDAIPEYFLTNLELRDVIETMANDLYTGKCRTS